MQVSIIITGDEILAAVREAAVAKGVPPEIAATLEIETYLDGSGNRAAWYSAKTSHASIPWRVRAVAEAKTEGTFTAGPYR